MPTPSQQCQTAAGRTNYLHHMEPCMRKLFLDPEAELITLVRCRISLPKKYTQGLYPSCHTGLWHERKIWQKREVYAIYHDGFQGMAALSWNPVWWEVLDLIQHAQADRKDVHGTLQAWVDFVHTPQDQKWTVTSPRKSPR